MVLIHCIDLLFSDYNGTKVSQTEILYILKTAVYFALSFSFNVWHKCWIDS